MKLTVSVIAPGILSALPWPCSPGMHWLSSVRDVDIVRRTMSIPAILTFLALGGLHPGFGHVPAATIRSPFIQISDENSQRSYNGWDRYAALGTQSRPSYVIYDRDVDQLYGNRDRPQQLSTTRSWHIEFNKNRQAQESRPSPTFAYQTAVYSNLIQVKDEPQRKYFGPYDGKSYINPDQGFYKYPRPQLQPANVPTYEVIYPYENPTKNYEERLPDRFPTPFLPNSNFEFKDSAPYDNPRKDIGFYRTQTVNYGQNDPASKRKDQCNYMKLNEKGFPVGNELCGRSISDILLAPDYPTTGELAFEHRKRYRGVKEGKSLDVLIGKEGGDSKEVKLNRRKRNADNYYPSKYRSCCSYRGTEYGYSSDSEDNNDRYKYGPYNGRGYEGQYVTNYGDDDGQASRKGLTSYMRGDHGRDKDSEEKDDGDNRENSKDKRNKNRNKGSGGSSNNQSSRGSNSYNNRQDQSTNGSSYEGYGHDWRNRERSGYRNFGGYDDEEDRRFGYGNRGGYGRGSGGRYSSEMDRGYGMSDSYGGGYRGNGYGYGNSYGSGYGSNYGNGYGGYSNNYNGNYGRSSSSYPYGYSSYSY